MVKNIMRPKIGIIVAYHNFVNKFIMKCIESLDLYTHDNRFISIIDNESTHKDNNKVVEFIKSHKNFHYLRIENQTANGGLSGAWDNGIDLCIKNGCDSIIIMNDDIIVNETWDTFIASINSDNTIYGPLTNNPGRCWSSNNKKDGIRIQLELINNIRTDGTVSVGFVNGFCFGSTTNTYISNRFNQEHYFNPKYPFGGNETEFQIRLFGGYDKGQSENLLTLDRKLKHDNAKVVTGCFVYHYKNNGWHIGNGGNFGSEEYN